MYSFLKFLSIIVLILFFHFIFYNHVKIDYFDYMFYDFLNKEQFNKSSIELKRTVVVKIDEKSLQALGQWPWNRIIIAKLIEEISNAKPASIGVDIFFPEKDRTSAVEIENFYKNFFGYSVKIGNLPTNIKDNDKILASVLRNTNAVLPFVVSYNSGFNKCNMKKDINATGIDFQNIPKIESILCSYETINNAAKGIGFINYRSDVDGLTRTMNLLYNYNGALVGSLGFEILRSVDKNLKIIQNNSHKIDFSFLDFNFYANKNASVLNHSYPSDRFKSISAIDVLEKNYNPNIFSGKFVLIGATANGLYDKVITPEENSLAGVFFHASFLENVFLGKLFYQPENFKNINFLFSILFSLILLYFIFNKKYLFAWAMFLILVLIFVVFSKIMLHYNMYISVVYFLLSFSIIFFASSLLFAVLHFLERKKFLEKLTQAHSATIDVMAVMVENRDTDTGNHIQRTKIYAKMIAEYLYKNKLFRDVLDKKKIDLIYRAAPLHDIGKIGISDLILQKPAKLSFEEMEKMKEHSAIGKSIIQNVIKLSKENDFLETAEKIAFFHHEKWDGTGYPLGLKGNEIPLEARIMALADVYDALISKRCYKNAIGFEETEKIILDGDGSHFDPIIVQAFRDLKDKFMEVAINNK